VLLNCERHRGGGFACTDDQRAPFGRLRQMCRHELQGIGSSERSFEAAQQKFSSRRLFHLRTFFR
jgi:hypothetical protein